MSEWLDNKLIDWLLIIQIFIRARWRVNLVLFQLHIRICPSTWMHGWYDGWLVGWLVGWLIAGLILWFLFSLQRVGQSASFEWFLLLSSPTHLFFHVMIPPPPHAQLNPSTIPSSIEQFCFNICFSQNKAFFQTYGWLVRGRLEGS